MLVIQQTYICKTHESPVMAKSSKTCSKTSYNLNNYRWISLAIVLQYVLTYNPFGLAKFSS